MGLAGRDHVPRCPLAISWFVVVVIVVIVVFACTFVIVTDIVNIFIYPVTIFDNHLGAASPIVWLRHQLRCHLMRQLTMRPQLVIVDCVVTRFSERWTEGEMDQEKHKYKKPGKSQKVKWLRTDRPTDLASYRVALSRLKIRRGWKEKEVEEVEE